MAEVLVGLVGYAQAGKDRAADTLCGEAGYTRVAFADKLRELIWRMNNHIPEEETGPGESIRGLLGRLGYQQAKQRPAVRRHYQEVGESVREVLGESVWLDAAMARADEIKGPVVFTDVRYTNEAAAIHERGGFLVGVSRPGYGPVNNHISDTGVADISCDAYLVNDGDLAAWRQKVLDLSMTIQMAQNGWTRAAEAIVDVVGAKTTAELLDDLRREMADDLGS